MCLPSLMAQTMLRIAVSVQRMNGNSKKFRCLAEIYEKLALKTNWVVWYQQTSSHPNHLPQMLLFVSRRRYGSQHEFQTLKCSVCDHLHGLPPYKQRWLHSLPYGNEIGKRRVSFAFNKFSLDLCLASANGRRVFSNLWTVPYEW